MQRESNGRRKLDSWKEIAAHLGKTERTAIRWEKKGLPVYRVPGGQRQSVFAYAEEIDTWLVSQKTKTPEGNGNTDDEVPSALPETGQADTPAGESFLKFLRRKTLALTCIVLGLLATVVIVVSRIAIWHGPVAAAQPFRLTQLTEDGRYKLNLQTDGATIYLNEREGVREVLGAMPVTGGPIRLIPTRFSNVELEDLSRDRLKLLVTSFEGVEQEKPLWVLSTHGGEAQRLGNVHCREARWSPDNSRIACSSGMTILLLDENGSVLRTVGPFPSSPSRVRWSPEGNSLAFVQEDSTTHVLSPWVLSWGKDDSSEVARLPIDGNCCWDWSWTPSGNSLVYVDRDAEQRPTIVIKPRSASISGKLALGSELPLKIRTIEGLAPDKTDDKFYLLIESPYRGELLKFNASARIFQAFLHSISGEYLSFSRDGGWIAYSSTVDQTLWRSRIDGTDAVQLTKPPMLVELSAWSPDGQTIAFMGQEPGKPYRIFLIGRDGGVPEEASGGTDNQGAPTWSSDGRALVYGNLFCEEKEDCWIRRVDLTTRRTKPIPGSLGLRTARWSPNGKYVAALKPDTRELLLYDVRLDRWTALADGINGDNINWSANSEYVYVDNLKRQTPLIERVRIRDKHRTTVANLTTLQKGSGQISAWVGLTPDDSPIVVHLFAGSEIYSLEWTH